MAQPCQNRCRQIQATKTASIGLAYDFLRFLRLPHFIFTDVETYQKMPFLGVFCILVVRMYQKHRKYALKRIL